MSLKECVGDKISDASASKLSKENSNRPGKKKNLDSRDPAGPVLQKFMVFFFIIKFFIT